MTKEEIVKQLEYCRQWEDANGKIQRRSQTLLDRVKAITDQIEGEVAVFPVWGNGMQIEMEFGKHYAEVEIYEAPDTRIKWYEEPPHCEHDAVFLKSDEELVERFNEFWKNRML